ncbi:MAG: KOW domain-containing RNA-binding protein [Candidatus Contubernalis sp.]|nr:KOW domain-containing RNA-binding protein [Candidatus Contubernalis sp.]
MNSVAATGQLVCSNAGRDRGSYYIITRIIDDKFVEVANGSSRKINSSKRKNVKHLKIYPFVDVELANRLDLYQSKDHELVKALNKLLQKKTKQH